VKISKHGLFEVNLSYGVRLSIAVLYVSCNKRLLKKCLGYFWSSAENT